jgi:hypothetical protein
MLGKDKFSLECIFMKVNYSIVFLCVILMRIEIDVNNMRCICFV